MERRRGGCWSGICCLFSRKDRSKTFAKLEEVPFEEKMRLAQALLLEVAACRKVAAAVQEQKQRRSFPGVPAEALLAPRRAPRPLDNAHDGGTGPLIRKDPEQAHMGPIRTSFTAMVLPRWESLEVFDLTRLDVSKLVLSNDVGPPSLLCADCGRPTGPGEAILTLSCMHHFCPQCFEGFLRRQWADLATKKGADLEREQIPCPACGTMLGRPDVHTLNHAELAAMAQKRKRLYRSISGNAHSLSPNISRSSLASEATALGASTSGRELPRVDMQSAAVATTAAAIAAQAAPSSMLQSASGNLAALQLAGTPAALMSPLLATAEDGLRRLPVPQPVGPTYGRPAPAAYSTQEGVRGAGLWACLGEAPPDTQAAWPVASGAPEPLTTGPLPPGLQSCWPPSEPPSSIAGALEATAAAASSAWPAPPAVDGQRRNGFRPGPEALQAHWPPAASANIPSISGAAVGSSAMPAPAAGAQKLVAADAPAPAPRRVVPIQAATTATNLPPTAALKGQAGFVAPSLQQPCPSQLAPSPSETHRAIEANLANAIVTGPRRMAPMPMPAAA
mmetsp:Transcript_43672/g.103069  ORF Transcript_43672/g.103069 Transcript_43672/m.103069 type:complete len:562 (-) Transcript_43672:109-1794(-)